jgi:hypothetical protein
MKRESFFFSFFFLLALMPAAGHAQCSGGCMAGALTTLPATGGLAANTNYCIGGTVTNTTNFTITDTLVIQSGTVNLGAATLNSTGVIIVESGATLVINGLTGQYGVASTKTNLLICTGGFVQVTGTFQQYGMNVVLNDYAVLLVTGSWNAYASTPFYVNIGAGALVEDCGALTLDVDNFFTETSSSTSYVFIRGSITQGATPGWLSSSEGSSMINLTVQGSVSGLSYNTARSCVNSCTSTSLLPPGTTTTSTCGSTSDSYLLITLPLYVIDFSEQPSGSFLDFSADINTALPVNQVWLQSLSSADANAGGQSFTTLPVEATETAGAGGAAHYLFEIPMSATASYYRLMATSGSVTVYSAILAPPAAAASGMARVYPDPATDVIYLQQPGAAGYTQAVVMNTAGQLMQVNSLPAVGGTVRLDLPARLAAGIYFVRFTGAGLAPLTVPVLKTQ